MKNEKRILFQWSNHPDVSGQEVDWPLHGRTDRWEAGDGFTRKRTTTERRSHFPEIREVLSAGDGVGKDSAAR